MLDSPKRLSAVIIAGSLLGPAAFLGISHVSRPLAVPLLTALLTVVGLSMLAVLWAGARLRDGIESERWPEHDLAALRAVIVKPVYVVACFLLLGGMLLTLALEHKHRYFWSFFMLQQGLTQLAHVMKRPCKPPTNSNRLNGLELQPLRSEHWGLNPSGSSVPSSSR